MLKKPGSKAFGRRILKSMKANAKFQGVFAAFKVLSVSVAMASLSACGLLVEKNSTDDVKAAIEFKKPLEKMPQPEITVVAKKLDAPTMFEILAAEMFLQKGQAVDAFEILFPLAQETKDKGLAKRVFEIAMLTYDVARVEKATSLWREISPQSAAAWRAAFLMSLRRNDVETALLEWHNYHRFSGNDLQNSLVIAATKVASSVAKKSGLLFFQRLVEQYPQAWSSHFALGMVSSAYREPVIGIEALKQAQNLLPGDKEAEALPFIYNIFSKLYMYSEEVEEGIEVLSEYLENNPESLLIQERLARLEVRAERYEKAKRRYREILEIEPEAYTSRLSLALIELEHEEYKAAEQNLTAILSNQAYTSVAYYYLGILYQEQKLFAQAKKSFLRVNSADYYIDARLHIAEIIFAAEGGQAAFAVLDELKPTKDEGKVKVLRAKAIFKSAEKNYQQAIDVYDIALTLDKDNAEILKSQALLFYKSNQFDRYESALLEVLRLDNNDSDALNALGYFYVEQNVKLDQAYNLLEKALALSPESYYILDSLGWYFYQVKDYDKALTYLNKAFAIAEDDEVLIHLVSAYWQSGELNRAKLLWQKYQQKFLQNDRVQNLINELESGTAK